LIEFIGGFSGIALNVIIDEWDFFEHPLSGWFRTRRRCIRVIVGRVFFSVLILDQSKNLVGCPHRAFGFNRWIKKLGERHLIFGFKNSHGFQSIDLLLKSWIVESSYN
jgi:hypothetical protein